MNNEFDDKMRKVLLDAKSSIIDSLMSENADFKAAVEDLGVKDLGDIASNDLDVRTLEAVSSRDQLRMQKVDSALSRLENGKYGMCAKCSSKISIDRLEAIPYAVLCIDCKKSAEKHRY